MCSCSIEQQNTDIIIITPTSNMFEIMTIFDDNVVIIAGKWLMCL